MMKLAHFLARYPVAIGFLVAYAIYGVVTDGGPLEWFFAGMIGMLLLDRFLEWGIERLAVGKKRHPA